MYNIKISIKDNEIIIPIDEYCNKYKDISLQFVLNKNYNKIYSLLINNNDILDGFIVSLYDENTLLSEKTINKANRITYMLMNDFPDSQIKIEDTIEELFLSLDYFNIKIENNEITEVILNDKNIDNDWFINNIYKKDTGRYYRKIMTFNKYIILKRDVYAD